MKNHQRAIKQKPPYHTSIALPIGRSVVRVKLPKASDYEIGATAEVRAAYKGMPITLPLVRVEGGWNIREVGAR